TQTPPATPTPIPKAPTHLTATATSNSQIDLTWIDNSTDEIGFHVRRSPTGVNGTFTLIGTTGPGVTTYSDTGLTGSTIYYYRVFSFNSARESPPSNTASATTPP